LRSKAEMETSLIVIQQIITLPSHGRGRWLDPSIR
jgi:hypothetical protein